MEESNEIPSFSEVIKFHGHSCPGIATGYRASEVAIKKLHSPRAVDEEFLAIVENDSCSVDAIQVVTGCTMGKGNLIFKDHGKHVYTFINRDTGEALRIVLKMGTDAIDPEFSKIREKALSESATPEEIKEFNKRKNELAEMILDIPDDELFKIESVEVEIPEEARLFKTVKCSKCGELFAEHRARVENGKIICIPCFNDYSRT
ncbi:MAG: FmdE family protein [Methanothermobacter sp.]